MAYRTVDNVPVIDAGVIHAAHLNIMEYIGRRLC